MFAHAPVGVAILTGPTTCSSLPTASPSHSWRAATSSVTPSGRRSRSSPASGSTSFSIPFYESGEPFVGRSIRAAIKRRGDTAEETFFDLVYQPLFDDDRRVTGIAVVVFDVTELTNARREAEAANRAKDEFLAMLGHELRNPLAPILTALQLMRLRDVPGAERERSIIERQVKHVVSLVDDLLDVSRITRGKVQLRRARARARRHRRQVDRDGQPG